MTEAIYPAEDNVHRARLLEGMARAVAERMEADLVERRSDLTATSEILLRSYARELRTAAKVADDLSSFDVRDGDVHAGLRGVVHAVRLAAGRSRRGV